MSDQARIRAHEHFEEPGRRRRKVENPPVDPGALLPDVEADRPDFEHVAQPPFAAMQSLNAQFQFFHRERLDEVVVGAGGETLRLVLDTVARRQQQYRHGTAQILAQPAAERETVDTGQHDVQNDHVVGLRGEKMQRRQPIGCMIEFVAIFAKVVEDVCRQCGMVFNEKESQGFRWIHAERYRARCR